ncbi:rhodanese-like domain-containing protein [Maricaulis sp.]|uniref:rhodanese-like domain-containing protein n=1 Tax=Maricaulis sp. TaxID=1486257 RepID=UPI003A914E10
MSLRELDPKTAVEAMQSNKAILIDVREPREYASERIHGALLFPLSTFDPAALPVDKTREVIFHCGSGKRSADAVARCEAAGVPITTHVRGGLMAWKQAGLATIAIDPATGAVFDPQAV